PAAEDAPDSHRLDVGAAIAEHEQLSSDPGPDGMTGTLVLGGLASVRQAVAVEPPVVSTERKSSGYQGRQHVVGAPDAASEGFGGNGAGVDSSHVGVGRELDEQPLPVGLGDGVDALGH